MEGCNNGKKRVRDDSDLHSPGSKRIRVDSEINSPEWNGVDSEEPELNSPEANRFRDDFLDILDDTDTVTDRDPEIQDLDSVIKSFEEEILHPPAGSESGESQPELGYLLEASDDELGLPPAISPSDEQSKNECMNLAAIESEAVGLGEILGFENEITSYDSYGFEIVGETEGNSNGGNGEFVTLGGLFDYSDFSEFSWQPETLPAV